MDSGRCQKSERERGASWAKIAGAVGVHAKTLRDWCGEGGPTRMGRVQVTREETRTVRLASPSDYRIEDLTLEEAIAALGKFG